MHRELFHAQALEVAPRLLGSTLTVHDVDGAVTIRITEVEAYHGVGTVGPYDAGSHSRDRKTQRNASMFGPPGHAYVYFTYGMHYAINMVCSPEGIASGVLIRAGEVIAGAELATRRRSIKRRTADVPLLQLARGPGNVAQALGVTRESHDGSDLFRAPFELGSALSPVTSISSGPRVGVSGIAGGADFPWRFWITGNPTVSSYRPGKHVPGVS